MKRKSLVTVHPSSIQNTDKFSFSRQVGFSTVKSSLMCQHFRQILDCGGRLSEGRRPSRVRFTVTAGGLTRDRTRITGLRIAVANSWGQIQPKLWWGRIQRYGRAMMKSNSMMGAWLRIMVRSWQGQIPWWPSPSLTNSAAEQQFPFVVRPTRLFRHC